MNNYKHYIPILKWKPAEQLALEKLSIKEKKFISPLIQLVMPSPKTPKKNEKEKTYDEQLKEVINSFELKIPKIPEEIQRSWGNDPIMIDLSLIYTPSLRIKGFDEILRIGESLGIFLIPVINLSSDEETKKTVALLAKKYRRGLCFRLVRSDFIDMNKLTEELQNFLKLHSLSEKEIDLLVDLKDDDKNEYSKLINLVQQIPNLLDWRTFIFASGAFPVDLTDCKVNQEKYITRSDWKNWITQINSGLLKRCPSYADYTIQHPIYKESVRFFSPSASIRYTLKDSWLILRGRRGKSVYYLAYSNLLSQSQKYQKIFRGSSFSFGDAYIVEKGKDLNSKHPGGAKDWLVAGINHHLACTIDQIANLT